MAYDFSNLTAAQQRLLTFQGWAPNDFTRQPHKATVRKLIERGLVIPHEITTGRVGSLQFFYTEYEVPTPVHMAWCAYCSEREAANVDR